MTATDADIRASDAERDRAIGELRSHATDGRLDVAELERRIGLALAAPTRGKLAEVLSDLPSLGRDHEGDSDLRGHVLVFAGVQVLLVAIWALTGAGYFWPVWPFMGWGIGVLSHAAACLSRTPRRAYHGHTSRP